MMACSCAWAMCTNVPHRQTDAYAYIHNADLLCLRRKVHAPLGLTWVLGHAPSLDRARLHSFPSIERCELESHSVVALGDASVELTLGACSQMRSISRAVFFHCILEQAPTTGDMRGWNQCLDNDRHADCEEARRNVEW